MVCLLGIWLLRLCWRNWSLEIKEFSVYDLDKQNISITVTLAMTSIMRFYYTKILTNLFGGYRDVNNIEQFWHYMENDLINNMYWEYDYGIDAKKQKSYNCPDGDNSIGPCSLTPEDRNVLYENKLLGLPR